MQHFIFKDPVWLLALVVLPIIVWVRGRRRVPVLLVPFAAAWHRPSLVATSRWPVWLGLGSAALVIIGLARPQRVEDKREVHSQGYDIMLCVDLSGSMLTEDYEKSGERLNRLQAIKPVIQAFIHDRPSDRIGVVLFAERAYTLAPLTFDHDWLARQLERIKIGTIEDNGTAIGDGIGVALSRLDQAKRESAGRRSGAFIVLLTDGANNRGILSPEQASDLAKARSIPIYTIGAGKDGYVPMPYIDAGGVKRYRMWLSDLDENALHQIADATGGKFFRAAETDTVESAFKAIDRARKIEFQAQSYLVTTELFWWLAGPGLVFAMAAGGLARPMWKQEALA